MARKRRHTRHIAEIIESSDVVYRGNAIVILQSRVADTLYILTKEQHPRLFAHTMPDGLIFWHKAESDGNIRRPYRRMQDDVLFWQNFDLEQERLLDQEAEIDRLLARKEMLEKFLKK